MVQGAFIGGASGLISNAVSGSIGNYLAKSDIGGAIGGAIQGTATAVSAGLTSGTMIGVANGESLGNSLGLGLDAAISGIPNGLLMGAATGAINSAVQGKSPLNGRRAFSGSVIVKEESSVIIQDNESRWTRVGRWMSRAELDKMMSSKHIVEGGGGVTFVTTGGPESYLGAPKGSVYVEFDVPTNSLLQGGNSNWYKAVGSSANNVMKHIINRQGGELLPKYSNLSNVLYVR